MMELNRKNVLVVGLGKSGAAAARFLKQRGASVTVTDSAPEKAFGDMPGKLREMGIRLDLGRHRDDVFTRAELIVLSPGVPHTLLPIRKAASRGAEVIGEIELASRFIREPILAVTGTNGKTTTTTLLGAILRRSGFSVFVGGNIGAPLIDYVEKAEPADRVVVEVSSFQLDTIETFRPAVGVLLNITADHLDRYPEFSAYARSKSRLFMNQGPGDTAVINGDDPVITAMPPLLRGKRLAYSRTAESAAGASIQPDSISFHSTNGTSGRIDTSALRLMGSHNMENIAAAGLAALAAGASLNAIRETLDDFAGLPHRMETVGTVNGVAYVDDSKATNVDAVVRALESFTAPVVLILGGCDKGGDYDPLIPLIRDRVKTVFLIGEAADIIENTLIRSGLDRFKRSKTMEQAVMGAADLAESGDVVLLSPACSSFDMFSNYKERGNRFKEAVERL